MTQHDVYSNILAMLIVGAADQPLRLITPGKVLLRGHVYGIPEQTTHQQVRIGELQGNRLGLSPFTGLPGQPCRHYN